MTEKNTGGPAYPCTVWTKGGHKSGESMGMTLRDWFAGQALVGVVSAASYDKADWADIYAAEAYQMADAMLRARSNGEPQVENNLARLAASQTRLPPEFDQAILDDVEGLYDE